MGDIIHIKPHHFIDIIASFDNKEIFSPHKYGHAQHIIAKKIFTEKQIILIMELGIDDICNPCIHNINGICDDIIDTSFRPKAPKSKNEWNLLIDRRWCERLNIKQGDRLTPIQFCYLLKEKGEDISDIYRELPPDRIIKKQVQIKNGIEYYLHFFVNPY
ncbi:MAG: hypothetical protein NC905_04440 [Candidatus Omnitrophica bacterium]|nr:hypothetical protein [Candidatus Omnitrophota bacterium]